MWSLSPKTPYCAALPFPRPCEAIKWMLFLRDLRWRTQASWHRLGRCWTSDHQSAGESAASDCSWLWVTETMKSKVLDKGRLPYQREEESRSIFCSVPHSECSWLKQSRLGFFPHQLCLWSQCPSCRAVLPPGVCGVCILSVLTELSFG